MNTYTIVRPEHLNHHGYLFGGAMLRWVDEYAWLVASRDFQGCTLVTVAMEDVQFRKRVVSGAILRFEILPDSLGKASVSYGVRVYADAPGAREEEEIFSTRVTFVGLDGEGRPLPLPRLEIFRSMQA
ncbi:acyl-CoA thioesterase [Desulfobotulus sp.]|jgi:acyl-CoA hydrolase|uniref:acyl-CoA thioesterase n=1 Tax=Desulfobotulus sp. TaxID=1940337 RepID=UPI002A36A70B|nr:hotdog domain-containing protein [Desulfobotulus sp.]MDY0163953.1 hotdog domain-containing protein [Desulfobotulus sp.]